MKNIYKLILFIIFVVFTSCKKETKKALFLTESNQQWKSLFNGKNLDGWTPKFNGFKLGENYKNTFKVENGVLKVSYNEYDTFTDQYGHLFYKTSFTNYKLRLHYRFIEKQVNGGQLWASKNSGVMLHCQTPESMLTNQAFPISLEVQLLGGLEKGKERPSGNLCTPGTHVEMNGKQITEHCITADSNTYYGEEWITAEVIVNKGSIKHYINNKLVISYTNPVIGGQFLETASPEIQAKKGQKLTSGYISLQSESHPIEFKNIELMEI